MKILSQNLLLIIDKVKVYYLLVHQKMDILDYGRWLKIEMMLNFIKMSNHLKLDKMMNTLCS